MKSSPPPNQSLIQPMSMEDKSRYVALFVTHKGMIALFSDDTQRHNMAAQIFVERWEAAPVTVKKLNGEMFFID